MQLVTAYAPPTFLKPCIVFSTLFNDQLQETAIIFVEALNTQYALEVLHSSKDHDKNKSSEPIPIKHHSTMDEAAAFHVSLAKTFRNGCSTEIWEAGWPFYLELYDKHCPTFLKKNWDLQTKEEKKESI